MICYCRHRLCLPALPPRPLTTNSAHVLLSSSPWQSPFARCCSFETHPRQDYGVDFPSRCTSPNPIAAEGLCIFAATACARRFRVCWCVGDSRVNLRQAPQEGLQRVCNKTAVFPHTLLVVPGLWRLTERQLKIIHLNGERSCLSLPYNYCSETANVSLFSQPFACSTYLGIWHTAIITLYQLQNIEMW